MAMKPTDLARLKGTKIMGQMKLARGAARPDQGAAAIDRREQRRLDTAAGLVPFAVKLDRELVKQLSELADARGVSLAATVDELLRKGLGPTASTEPAKERAK